MDNILQHYSEDEQLFVKKMLDLKETVLSSEEVKFTDFLTMREQQILTSIMGPDTAIKWYGGHESAERKLAAVASNETLFESLEEEKIITKFFIKFNKKYGKIQHRAALGSLLSLGIDRKVVGDIIITSHKSYLIVTAGIADFVRDNLEKIGRTKVELLVTTDAIPAIEEKFIEKTLFVKSLRVDGLLAYALNLSRDKTKEHIEGKNIQMNWQTITDSTKEIEEGMVISVRKFGRIYVDEITTLRNEGKYKLKIRQLV